MSEFFQLIQEFLSHHTLLAPIFFVILHILFAVCLIPCSPMAVIAGLLWGTWLGLWFSIMAAFFSCCATFALSRFLFKHRIYQFMKKRYAKTDLFLEKTAKHGWKFVAAVQLNPAAPASTLGYLFGLTSIDFVVYAKYLIIFMFPLQIIFVSVGNSLSNINDGHILKNVFDLCLIVTACFLIYKLSRKKVEKWSLLNED